ncbi:MULTISPECIES: META domain-containing protein [unclassified Myroides]|uniref:META domain-containing protein n=1 Tax=unclassified Myroides TaxID=2642485 RepID=UPI003D2F72A1
MKDLKIAKMKKMKFLTVGLMALALTACNEKKTTEKASENVDEVGVETAVTTQAKLFGSWELISIHTEETTDKKIEDLFPGKRPTLNFEGNLMVHGNDGCNNLTGEYELKENNGIVIGDKLASTRMFCEGVSDFAFTKGLTEVTNYEITESALLFKKGNEVVMEFKQVSPDIQPEVK